MVIVTDEEWRHTRSRENGPDLKGLLLPLISEGKYPFPGRPVATLQWVSSFHDRSSQRPSPRC